MTDRSRSETPVNDQDPFRDPSPQALPDAGPGPALGDDGAPPPPEKPELIEVKVQASGGNTVVFKIKMKTKMQKVKEAWCDRHGSDPQTLRFLFDGQRVLDNDTPNSVSKFSLVLPFGFVLGSLTCANLPLVIIIAGNGDW